MLSVHGTVKGIKTDQTRVNKTPFTTIRIVDMKTYDVTDVLDYPGEKTPVSLKIDSEVTLPVRVNVLPRGNAYQLILIR